MQGFYNYTRLPFVVSPSSRNGLIGWFKLTGNSGLYSTGVGGKLDITFVVSGTASVGGRSFSVDNTTGYISVSASEWKGLQRPDFTNITYYWPGAPPVNLSLSVPGSIVGAPADAYMMFGVDANSGTFGMNATQFRDVADQALNYAIQGILWVNEKMAGWAIKTILPLPF